MNKNNCLTRFLLFLMVITLPHIAFAQVDTTRIMSKFSGGLCDFSFEIDPGHSGIQFESKDGDVLIKNVNYDDNSLVRFPNSAKFNLSSYPGYLLSEKNGANSYISLSFNPSAQNYKLKITMLALPRTGNPVLLNIQFDNGVSESYEISFDHQQILRAVSR